MEQLRELISFLKMYRPKILSAGSSLGRLKHAALYRKGQNLLPDTVFIGYLTDIRDLLRFYSNQVFFIIADNEHLPEDWHGNYCVSFPAETSVELLLEECRRYFDVQSELHEYSHVLLEIFLDHGDLQALIAEAARMIGNPIMIIDENYRVLYESGSESCSDIVWNENIRNGYCSYEFVAQFNKISEVRSIQINDSAFMSGCLNSPLRRCICKLRCEDRMFGYLLSIELNSPFDELKIQIISLVSRMISRAMTASASDGSGNPLLPISDLFSDLLTGKIQSKELMKNYLEYSGVRMKSDYYLISINIEAYNYQDADAHYALDQALFQRFDHVLSTCVRTKILMLIESADPLPVFRNSLMEHQDFLIANGLTLTVSDPFRDLTDLPIYYRQTNYAHHIVRDIHLEDKTICTYDNVRIMDIISQKPTLENYQQLIGSCPARLHDYDKLHGTEYFKTLYYYIRWNRNLKKAAEILHVHKNTVSYRVQRAKEIFGLDMDDFHVTMHLYMAYLIYLYKDNNLLRSEDEA